MFSIFIDNSESLGFRRASAQWVEEVHWLALS